MGSSAAGLVRGVYGGTKWPDHRIAEVQRRTVRTLVVSQALGGLGMSIGIAVAALLAEDLSGSEKLAGLAQTMQVLGTAVASFLLAHVMGRRGRRIGLSLGYVLGAAGAALCVVAGLVRSFPLMLVGTTLLGSATAANNQSRYAATDLARPEKRARALSVVVWATTIGAVAGPNLTGIAGEAGQAVGVPALAGPFLFGTLGMLVAALVVSVSLRPDPLLVAREAAIARGGAVRGSTSWGRVVEVARTRPGVAAGAAALALAHAVMISVMVMTPLHMHHGGATLEVIGVVISVHVLGMFAFAPVVGWATDRFGRPMVLSAGAVVLLVLPGAVRLGAGRCVVPDRGGAVPARSRLVAVHHRGVDPAVGVRAARRAHRRAGRGRPGDGADRRGRRRPRRRRRRHARLPLADGLRRRPGHRGRDRRRVRPPHDRRRPARRGHPRAVAARPDPAPTPVG